MKTQDIYAFIKKNYITVLVCLLGLAGILLIADRFSSKDTGANPTEAEEYRENLENRLGVLLSGMEGVGRCVVMITLETEGDGIDGTESDIRGVAVLCDGGGNSGTKSAVSDLVCAFLGVSGSRVSVGILRSESIKTDQ